MGYSLFFSKFLQSINASFYTLNNERDKFLTLFGVCHKIFWQIWQILSPQQSSLPPKHLQWTLFWVKNCPNLDVCAVNWHPDEKMFNT
jgi:hypothetical protein